MNNNLGIRTGYGSTVTMSKSELPLAQHGDLMIFLYHSQITFTVDYGFDRPQAVRGLDRIEERVKIGDIRATLIIQTLEDIAEVTINAGTSEGL